MSDPISLIVLGAAAGGTAGKLAERTWDRTERWLRERFGTHDQKVQDHARKNASQFIDLLERRVERLEKRDHVGEPQIVETEGHPQFSALLQRCLLNAAQTDDELKQDMLASLVASRLASKTETTFALASQLASDAIACSTRKQLELMALLCFVHEIRPQVPISPIDYRKWLEVHLRRFEYCEFHESDAWHLVAIACASYDPRSTPDLDLLLKMKGGIENMQTEFADLLDVEVLSDRWDYGLGGVFLTSVGSIVGGLSLGQLLGRDLGPPSWSK